MELIVEPGWCPIEHACIAHCVSADGAMGAGFAAQIHREHKRSFIAQVQQHLEQDGTLASLVGGVIYTRHANTIVANLITKVRSYDKPTYESFQRALDAFVRNCGAVSQQDWHSPKLGCGLDRLDWRVVEPMLRQYAATQATNTSKWTIHVID